MRLWDGESGHQIAEPLKGPGAAVLSVTIGSDGKRLASARVDKTVRLWDVEVHSRLRRACEIANRNFTHNEWQKCTGDPPLSQDLQGLAWPRREIACSSSFDIAEV